MQVVVITTRCLVLAVLLATWASAGRVGADDQAWPARMNAAGFSIVGISGSMGPDGSGTASGEIQLSGIGGRAVSLSRSSAGDVTGTATVGGKLSGVEIQGNFVLDGSGFKGKGAIKCAPRPIIEASIVFEPNGKVTGSGVVEVGGAKVPAKFILTVESFSVKGSVPAQAHADTPLASYEFTGNVELGGAGGKLAIQARGLVKRSGKVSNQVTSQDVSDAPVDPSDGVCRVNVGGVTVAFDLL